MPRPRKAATTLPRAGDSGLLATAERMVGQIEALVTEIDGLRRDNDALRTELRDAVALMQRASSALGGQSRPAAPRRGRPPKVSAATAAPVRRRAGAGSRRGRATPASVTAEMVLATIARLGEPTAGEIATDLSRRGAPVSGRAIRHIAERAGSQISVDSSGQRRYGLPASSPAP